ncbi:transcription factor atf21 [Pochonia chlamydosporia 170]|uniref:Transcription factor atf21 n=1 Tax=Pochonia chlamydosporia 170 TaxID=1380566 RepID=A0A179FI85_METCM|nr:transcription factor atf21 [Pochonia chlamydosporia 170]OAQ64739.1 transcription factor atf21 [Pochonia chlamydosporia 170]
METICTEHQPHHFVMGAAVEFPFWEQPEPWEGYLESCNPEFQNPFEDHSPGSSFDGNMNWIDGCEHLYYAHSPISPMAVPSAAGHPPEAINSIPSEAPRAQAQEARISNSNHNTNQQKRKRRQPQSITKSTNSVDSKPKRPCRSRSTSFSPVNVDVLSNKDDNDNDREDVYLERSRIASNKFRERKRNEIAQLESEEYTIEDANRQLRGMLDALTSEILSLKMQLLQHTNCNCELIQAYISKEAHHFVKSLQGVAKG